MKVQYEKEGANHFGPESWGRVSGISNALSQGYENTGWKDAGDSVVYPDGSRVKGPQALCDLQGYTYDAWLRMADVFEYFRDTGVCHQIATERCRRLLRKREMCFSHEFGPGPLAR